MGDQLLANVGICADSAVRAGSCWRSSGTVQACKNKNLWLFANIYSNLKLFNGS
jgi:hypothetical protein